MRTWVKASLAAGLSLAFPAAVWAQVVNACDLNQDGVVDVVDVQSATNMALGFAPCSANVAGLNVCNIVVVQRVTSAALTGTCVTRIPHSASLPWTARTSTHV